MGPDPILSLVRQVNVDRLRSDVAQLASGERHSVFSPMRHADTVDYISSIFAECGLSNRQHTYELGGRHGINIVGSLTNGGSEAASSPDRLCPLLVSAHYDTVLGSPGADDNASGVAALLECARVLSMVKLRRGVEFIAFDMEENQPEGVALAGSRAFVKDVVTKAERANGGKDAYEGAVQPGDGRL